MNTENHLKHQVQLWSLMGPAAVLLTVSIILVKAPFIWETLPLIAFVGLIAAWFQGMRGVGVCILVLAAASLVEIAAEGGNETLWIIGGASSLALAWIATALGKEEVDQLLLANELIPVPLHVPKSEPIPEPEPRIIEKIIVDETQLNEAKGRVAVLEEEGRKVQEELTNALEEIQSLQKQGEQFPIAMKKIQTEQAQALAVVRKDLDDALRDNFELEKKLKEQIELLKEELDEKHFHQQEILRGQSGVESLRIELDNARRDKEKALFEAQSSFERLMQEHTIKLQEHEKQIQDKDQLIQSKEQQIKFRLSEIAQLHQNHALQVQDKEKQIHLKEQQIQNRLQEIQQLISDHSLQIQGKEKIIQEHALQILQKDQQVQAHEQSLKLKEIDIESLKAQISQAWAQLDAKAKEEQTVVWGDSSTKEGRALSRVEGMYQQLRSQYEEKSNTLDQTRFDLFHAKEQLELVKKEREEEHHFDRTEWVQRFEQHIIKLEKEIQVLEKENAALETLVSKMI